MPFNRWMDNEDVVCKYTYTHTHTHTYTGLPHWLSGRESTCNAGAAGDVGLIPGSGRSPAGEHGNPLQYSHLENPMDRGPGGLQSIGLQTVRHNWSHLAHTYTYIHIHTMEYYSTSKKNTVTCSNMFGLIDYHTKWSQTEKDKYHMISLICGIKETNTNEFIYETETDPQAQKANLQLSKGEGGGEG